MATIHFLNVKDGDCSIIEHNVGHKTVIDVCNAKPVGALQEAQMAKAERGISGNFQQKKYPVNPISYMRDRSLSSIFRYVQTHPDMDHLDGIEALFREFSPTNFWDTDNTKEMLASSWQGSSYRESDWKFYKNLRDTDPDTDQLVRVGEHPQGDVEAVTVLVHLAAIERGLAWAAYGWSRDFTNRAACLRPVF